MLIYEMLTMHNTSFIIRHSIIYTSIFAITLILFVLYNYISIVDINWFFHPDERDSYSIAKNLYSNGSLYINDELNSKYQYRVFTPDGSSSIGDKILPARSLGLSLFISPFFIFGDQTPFYLISLFGLVLVAFIYLLTRKCFNTYIAALTTVFFAFSPIVIYWNNMLFSNIPALTFFIVGIYLYLSYRDDIKLNFLTGFFFSVAVWLRYDYSIYIGLFLLVLFLTNFTKQEFKKIIITFIFILLFVTPILYFNKNLYGSFFSFGYTQDVYDVKKQENLNYGVSNKDSLVSILTKYSLRFTGQFRDPHLFTYLQQNIFHFLISYQILIVVFGSLGIISLKNTHISHNKIYFPLIVTSAFILIYFGSSNSLEGFGTNWLSSSYTRYFLIPIYTLSLSSAIFIYKYKNRPFSKILIIFILTFYSVFSINLAFNSSFGLVDTGINKKYYHSINTLVSSLPENSIIISNFYSKAILSRPVLTPRLLKVKNKDVNSTVLNITDQIINKRRVYVFENQNHPSFLNLYDSFNSDKRFHIRLINSTSNNYYEISHSSSKI